MQLSELLDKITSDLAVDGSTSIEAESELLMSGVIDSLGIMDLVTWIEDQVGAEIDPGDVVSENFETPAAILAFAHTLA